jgi:hypothetical protein
MTTDIGSLAAGLDVHVVRIGIGRPNINNTFFTDVHLFSPHSLGHIIRLAIASQDILSKYPPPLI